MPLNSLVGHRSLKILFVIQNSHLVSKFRGFSRKVLAALMFSKKQLDPKIASGRLFYFRYMDDILTAVNPDDASVILAEINGLDKNL